MSYLQIVDLVFLIITILFTLLTIHYVIFAIVGLFAKKKFAKTEKKLKYGIVVSARNEEEVIANLIDSIKKNKYPQENLQIFVVAHNCTDNTAQIARDNGAIVYEYNNSNEKTKGYALKFLFDRIKDDYGVENYDGFFVFDSDNLLTENYIDTMNDAFIANGNNCVITSFRNSKNFGSNLISAMYGLFFMQGCRYEMRGRTVLDCSTRVSGTGFLISSDILVNGWPYVTLTEDWEFTADRILNGTRIIYCDEAEFFDEQPTKVKIMLRQRLRWAKGHLLVCLTRYAKLVKNFFRPKRKGGSEHKFSTYDISVNILPLPILSLSMFVVQAVLLAFAPLLGYSAATIWLNWAIDFAKNVAWYYVIMVLAGIILIIAEHKRIKHVNFFVMLGAILLWPLFLFISIPLEFLCIFIKNVGWKTIPHKHATTIENIKKS